MKRKPLLKVGVEMPEAPPLLGLLHWLPWRPRDQQLRYKMVEKLEPMISKAVVRRLNVLEVAQLQVYVLHAVQAVVGRSTMDPANEAGQTDPQKDCQELDEI